MLPSEKREGLRSCFSKRERRNTIMSYRIFLWKGEDVQMWSQVSGNVGRCIRRRHSFKKALTVDLWFMFAVSTLWANVCVCDLQHYSPLCCKNTCSLQCYIPLPALFSEDRALAQFHLVVTHFQIFRSFILHRGKWSLWFLSKNNVYIWEAN